MTDSKTLKLLLVEDNLEDEQLLCEALIEIEENRLWCNWRNATVLQVDRLMDALDCLRAERFDAVLLNLSLPDSPALLDTLLETRACATGTPIIVLADEEDEPLANCLLREGAQDVYLKSELECAPLARAVRYAIERQRRMATSAASPLSDDLTGTLTRPAFLAMAEQYARLAFDSHIDLHLASVEVAENAEAALEDREARELVLMRAGEALRDVFDKPALIGHLDETRFGLVVPSLAEETLEALLQCAAAKIEEGCSEHPVAVKFSVLDLNPSDCIQDVLDEAGIARQVRCELKPAMLAD